MRFPLYLTLLLFYISGYSSAQNNYSITGELKLWHTVTIKFNGPQTSEHDSINPFSDYRLNVLFSNADTSFLIPGYYAADGNAGETGDSSGNKWKVNFVPVQTGYWHFKTSFRYGSNTAISLDDSAGTAESSRLIAVFEP